jgi:O-antigen/teichoic acid export membrane protein
MTEPEVEVGAEPGARVASLGGRLASGTFNYGLGRLVPQLLAFVLLPVYAAFLSPQEYGVLDLAGSLSGFLMILMRLGVPGSLPRHYVDHPEGPALRDYVTTLAKFIFWASVGVGVLVMAVGPLLVRLLPGVRFFPHLLIVVVTAVLAGNSDLQRRLIQAREQSGYSVRLTLAMSAVSIVFSLVFVVGLRGGAVGMLLAQLLTGLVFFAQAQHYLRPELKGHFNRPMLRRSVQYATGILPSHFLQAFNPLLVRTILAQVGSLGALGLFGIATRFTTPLTVITAAFATAYNPIYFTVRKDNSKAALARLASTTHAIWTLAIGCFLGITLLAPPAIRLCLPGSFHASAPLIPVLALGFLGQIAYIVFGAELFFQESTWRVPVASGTSAIVALGLTALLVRQWGALGVAWADTAGDFASAMVAIFLSIRLVHVPHDWSTMLKTAALGALAYLATVLVAPGGAWQALAVGGIALAGFAFALYLFRDPLVHGLLARLRTSAERA